MQTLQRLYFSLSIKFRIGLLCFCYSVCIIAATLLGRSDSFAIRYGSLGLFIALGAFFGILNMWGIGSSIQRVIGYLQTLAQGDFSQPVVIRNNNEISKILMTIRDVQDSMRSIISAIQTTSGDLTAAAANLRQTSESMAAGTEQAVGQSALVVQAVEDLSSVTNDISRNCQLMGEKASDTKTAAIEGERTVGEMYRMMYEIGTMVTDTTRAVGALGSNSNQIGEIVGTIEDIADQTNLLALNAAIEAARAGEQGRGFAVVADEVRRLAERTTMATSQIQKIIVTLQGDVKNVMGSMQQSSKSVQSGVSGVLLSSQAISGIKSHIEVLADSVAQVATALEEQSATTSGVMSTIRAVTGVIDKVSHGTTETDKAASELAASALKLKGLADRFQV